MKRCSAFLFAAGFLASLASTSFADTLTFKCSFKGLIPQDIVYVINSEAKDVAVIGNFGTHQAFMLSYNEGFFYILEPNAGASAVTILYVHADDTAVGVRTTLGRLTDAQYAGIPDVLKLSGDKLRFMATDAKGRCPVQR